MPGLLDPKKKQKKKLDLTEMLAAMLPGGGMNAPTMPRGVPAGVGTPGIVPGVNVGGGQQMNLSPEQMQQMTFDELNRLRALNPGQQQQLAPIEHQAFMREFTQENPILGAALGTVGNAGYEALKAAPQGLQELAAQISPRLDVTQSRSGPSMANFMGGLQGTIQGLGFGGPSEDATLLRQQIMELQQMAASANPQYRQQIDEEIKKKMMQLQALLGSAPAPMVGMNNAR